MTQTLNYPLNLDTSGVARDNRIIDERHTISSYIQGEYRFVVPKMAPFFTMNYEVYAIDPSTNSRRKLERYTDYAESHPYKKVTDTLQKQVCGSIMILDTAFSGTVSIDYNSIGGPFCVDSAAILAVLANKLVNPITVDWSTVVNVPSKFPPEMHYHPAENLGEYGELTKEVKNLTDAVLHEVNVLGDPFKQHLNDRNPHGITLDMLGAAHIRNTKLATSAEVEAAVDQLAILTAASLGVFARVYGLQKPGGAGTTPADRMTQLENEVRALRASYNNVKNYGVPSSGADLQPTVNNLYARICDVFSIVQTLYANGYDALDPNNASKLITPAAMHTVINDYIQIGSMFFLPRAMLKTTRCIIPNGARFDVGIYPQLHEYLGSDVLPSLSGLYIKTYNPGVDQVTDITRIYDGTGVLNDVNGTVDLNIQSNSAVAPHFHLIDSLYGGMSSVDGGGTTMSYSSHTYMGNASRYDIPGNSPAQGDIVIGQINTTGANVYKNKNGDGRYRTGNAADDRYSKVRMTSLPFLNNSAGAINVVTGDVNASASGTARLNLQKNWIIPEPRHTLLTLVMRGK